MNDRLDLLKDKPKNERDLAWEEYFGEERGTAWFEEVAEEPLKETFEGVHPAVGREAARRELTDHRSRSVNARGHGNEKFRLMGERAGRRAKAAKDVQKHLTGLPPQKARAFIRGFTKAFAESQGLRDSDEIAMTGFGQYLEYKRLARERRTGRLASEVEKIEATDFERENIISRAKWKKEIRRLSAATGRSEAFITAYLKAYHKEKARRRLPRDIAVFDERRLPRLQLGGQLLIPLARKLRNLIGVIRFIKDLVPGTGLIEGLIGKDLVTGQRLGAADRGLGAVLDLLPFAGKALRGGATIVKAGAKLGRSALKGAEALAVNAVLTGMDPRAFLKMMNKVGGLSKQKLDQLQRRVRLARRRKKGFRATAADTRTAREVDDALAPLAAAAPRTARRFDLSSLPRETQAKIRQKGLTKVYQRYGSKLAHDDETLDEVASLLSKTGGNQFTYQTSRAAAGELTVIEQVFRNERVQTIRLRRPSNVTGSRTPDFEIDLTDGARQLQSVEIEVTTVTLSKRINRRAQKQPARGEDISSAERGRRAREHSTRRDFDTSKVKEAIIRKIRHGQIEDGVIVINIPNKGSLSQVLTAAERQAVQTALEGKDNIREIWAVFQRGGRRVIERVDAKPGSLGIVPRGD